MEPIKLNDEEAAAAINALAEGDTCLPGGFELGYDGRLGLILRAVNRYRNDSDPPGTVRYSVQRNEFYERRQSGSYGFWVAYKEVTGRSLCRLDFETRVAYSPEES